MKYILTQWSENIHELFSQIFQKLNKKCLIVCLHNFLRVSCFESIFLLSHFNQNIAIVAELQLQNKLAINDTYHQAIELYQNQLYPEALKLFKICLETLPEDSVIEFYIQECHKLKFKNYLP